MKIALYDSHESLPFGTAPAQPQDVFDPDRHAKLQMVSGGKQVVASDTRIWPILMALHNMPIPALAHVSAFLRPLNAGRWSLPERINVQISTLPDKVDEKGMPLVLSASGLTVMPLWGADGIESPYTLLEKGSREFDKAVHTADFCKEFSQTRLQEVVQQAARDVARAVDELDGAQKWLQEVTQILT